MLPAPDYLERRLPEGHVCLLCGDAPFGNGVPFSDALAQNLNAHGWPVVRWDPVLESPEQIPALLASITEAHGPIGAFVHMNPPYDGEGFSARDEALLEHTFLMAKYLKPSLAEAAQNGEAAFVVAMRLDGALGLTGGGSVVAGGLFGLVKTLALEWREVGPRGVHCRAVDFSPALDAERVVSLLLAELFDPDRRLVEVGWSENGRVTPVLE